MVMNSKFPKKIDSIFGGNFNDPLWRTLRLQNFLSQSKCLILLQKIYLGCLYHLQSFFVWQFRIMTEALKKSFRYWWLLHFFTIMCPLKSNLCFYTFSNMIRHLVFINLLFTLYIIYFIYIIYVIYYMFYIYNLHYILYFSVVF